MRQFHVGTSSIYSPVNIPRVLNIALATGCVTLTYIEGDFLAASDLHGARLSYRGAVVGASAAIPRTEKVAPLLEQRQV